MHAKVGLYGLWIADSTLRTRAQLNYARSQGQLLPSLESALDDNDNKITQLNTNQMETIGGRSKIL